VLAAEARKAGIASDDTLRTPRPPCAIGIEACSHWMSDKAEFVILLMADLKWLSKVRRAGLSADGEQRNRCSTFGELNGALKRVRASCAPIEASLSVALVSSSHLFAQVIIIIIIIILERR